MCTERKLILRHFTWKHKLTPVNRERGTQGHQVPGGRRCLFKSLKLLDALIFNTT